MTLKNIKGLKYLLFVLVATLLVLPFVIADFSTYPISGIKDVAYVGIQCMLIIFLCFSFIGLIGINKYIFTVIYPVFIFLCSILGYFAWTLNTTLTVMILDATLHNDWGTSSDLISGPLILIIIASLALSSVFIIYRFRRIKTVKYKYVYLICFILILLLFNNVSKSQRMIANHIPFNIYYVSSYYLHEQKIISDERVSLTKGSNCSTDSLTVVFVIGESLRADHLQLNGYSRNTTPELANTKNVVSLGNLYTKYTYTNKSLPFILTRADSLTEDLAYEERSFIDIFKACDYQTSWLANQESAHTYTYFMHECDTLIYATLNKSVYSFDKWLDGSLLPYYNERLSTTRTKKLIVLHTIGSHWWYNSHFTDEYALFTPMIKSKIVTSNSHEEMINSYDNTILYTDYFLVSLINRLQDKNAILIYLSDHGESLGENNVWLHAADSPPIHYPAGIVWMSDVYIQKYPEKYIALLKNSNKRYSESFLFHSILSAAGISSPYFNQELDIFNPE